MVSARPYSYVACRKWYTLQLLHTVSLVGQDWQEIIDDIHLDMGFTTAAKIKKKTTFPS